ncbi:acyl-CoA dehydrogenase family protein [Streptomyces chattanoogensis]|uniref:acyl-CoA dehydrogenase family protein n=1 Tax=Streptomyces chattanoogensis TaxID=66876 RepID=UPI0006B4E7BD|nr:acyl-CoA dehydrogenase [Streptomyces chattanoogensis]
MVTPAAYRSSVALEATLGNPFDPAAPVPYRSLIARDEREQRPDEAFEVAHQWGISRHLTPTGEGGRLTCFEELLSLLRVLARRDPVLAVGHGASLFAGLPVWMWGTAAQRALVAERLAAGEFGAIAISEDRAGSDLLATETTATPTRAGFRLDGEKRLISNATRGTFCTVLARSGPCLGLFLLDKRALPADRFRHLPKVPTLGLRGNDLSGIAFDRCEIPVSARLGGAGRGLEMLLTASSYVRVLACGIALGAADGALRIAADWARERRLYGQNLLALPPVRERLSAACLDLLTAECVAVSAARALTLGADRSRLWSSVAKYMVPLLCERTVRNAARVLSARFFLREGPASGMLQKFARDSAVMGILDGTSMVQLNLIASALRSVAAPHAQDRGPDLDPTSLFSLTTPAPPWRPRHTGLQLRPVARDEITQAWDGPRLAGRFALFDAERTGLTRRIQALTWTHGTPRTAYALARRHCLLHTAAACRHTWVHNRRLLDPELATPQWLAACWDRLLAELGLGPPEPAAGLPEDDLVDWLSRVCSEGRWPSLLSLPPPSKGQHHGQANRRGGAAVQ